MARVIVYHDYYGCETGCCGHSVELDGKRKFSFDHAHGQDPREFARELVEEKFGPEHVKDLDWEHCLILGDG